MATAVPLHDAAPKSDADVTQQGACPAAEQAAGAPTAAQRWAGTGTIVASAAKPLSMWGTA